MKKNIKKILTTSLIASFALTTALGVGVFAMPKAESDFSDFTMDTGAGVKMDEATGIRFTANVGEKTQASLENATNIVFGTLIAPTLGSDNQLTLDDVTDANVKAKNLVTAVWTDGATSYAETTSFKYNGAIVGDAEHVYPEEDYATALNAVGYVKYTVDSVEYVEYTTNTANRSLAQAVANSVANGVEDTSGFLEKVLGLTGVDIEKESVDMVVGGKETVATSTYTQAGIVWDSTDKNVATVENGVITAVGKGTATVSVTLGDYTDSISVNVGDYVDGSMMMVRQTNATYDLVTTAVNGRTNVYKYTDTTLTDWNEDRLVVEASAHPAGATSADTPYSNPIEAYNGMKTKGYKYVSIDVCLASGAVLRLDSMNIRNDYQAGSAINASWLKQDNANISLGNNDRGVIMANSDTVVANKWYTLVIDRENVEDATGSAWTFISFGGTKGTVYFDNVRYYGNKVDCYAYALANTKDGYVEYDGSELVWGGITNDTKDKVFYDITNETIGGRTGVYKWNVKESAGWNDKLLVYENAHGIGNTNITNSLPFAGNADGFQAAFDNLTTKGYNYITIDVYFESNALLRTSAPDTTTGKSSTRDDFTAGAKYTKNDNDCIEMYKDGVLVEVGTVIQANSWYTLVINHEDAIYTQASTNWSAINFSGKGVMYFDKVRYYSANPFA